MYTRTVDIYGFNTINASQMDGFGLRVYIHVAAQSDHVMIHLGDYKLFCLHIPRAISYVGIFHNCILPNETCQLNPCRGHFRVAFCLRVKSFAQDSF